MWKVTFLPSKVSIEVADGTTIMEAAIAAGLELDAPCGGRGVCGKCKVTVTDTEGERVSLACQTPVHGDMTVDLAKQDEGHRILMGGISRDVEIAPAVQGIPVEVAMPSVTDLRACWERLKAAICEKNGTVAQNIRQLCQILIDGVKATGEEVAQVVREHFLCIHARAPA